MISYEKSAEIGTECVNKRMRQNIFKSDFGTQNVKGKSNREDS